MDGGVEAGPDKVGISDCWAWDEAGDGVAGGAGVACVGIGEGV